jgi:hypothetical protein
MYKSSLIRNSPSFFDASLLHADTEKCMQILEHWDFGFVHQLLSFLRMDNMNASISASVRRMAPRELDGYIIAQRFSGKFLEPEEAAALRKKSKREYYWVLAHRALRVPGKAFWQYHRKGLKTVGQGLDRPYLSLQIIKSLLWMAVNPGHTAARVLRRSR